MKKLKAFGFALLTIVIIIIIFIIFVFLMNKINHSQEGSKEGQECISNKDCRKGLVCQESCGLPNEECDSGVCMPIGSPVKQ